MDDLPVVDRERLDLITRGDIATAVDFLAALIEEADSLLARLRVFSGNNEHLAVADCAHTLKGIAAEVGTMRLHAVAVILERTRDATARTLLLSGADDAVDEIRAFHTGLLRGAPRSPDSAR
jgi:HPt (histidine-containing phosphotransfer) domain-containing protein